MIGTCEICGDKVEAQLGSAYPVEGWEIIRAQGGANAITGRRRIPGRVAHAACVQRKLDRQRAGLSDGQGALL